MSMSHNDKRTNNETELDTLIASRYRIDKRIRINKNSNGNTYLVIDTKNNNDYKCLKLIAFSTQNKNELKEVIREESILSTLSSPYVVQYHESFLFNETICIVTEYCEGGDLAQRIKELKKSGRKLSEERILHWFSQLACACFYVHSKKILHRNIKPGNILIKNDTLKIGDFGISRTISDSEASTFIGTPYYMSPELVQNEKYNAKSDIWSIGCVLYELATYQRPFVGDNVYEIFDSIVKEETPSIQNMYSRELNNILKKTLTKSPADRPSAADLLVEPLLANNVKVILQRSIENASTPAKMASLINSLACLNELDDSFGDYDNKSTLKNQTPRNSL